MNLRCAIALVLTCCVAGHAQISEDEAFARLKAREQARHAAAATQPASSESSSRDTPPTTQPANSVARGTDVLEEKYDNGKIKARYKLSVAGVKWGPYALYSEDGKLAERGFYKNAQLDGRRQVFDSAGRVSLMESYRAGKFDGPRQVYYPNGQLKLQENYRAGRLDGELREFDDKGRPVRVARYRAGGGAKDESADVPFFDQTYVAGVLVYPRSPEMIVNELDRIAATKILTVAPSAPIPAHDGTGNSPEDRADAVRKLMQYRYLCDVPYENMAIDPVYCAHDEAAAAILKVIGKLDHTPANPGWPKDRYQYAYEGTSHSNLFEAGGGSSMCRESVGAYMDDSDASNVDRLGHRRWCLNPPMGKVGFASFGHFSAMWSFDGSRRQVPDFDYVAYPAPGPFPAAYFRSSAAWSVSLNPKKYMAPRQSDVKATITPVEVDVFENKIKPLGDPLEIKYFHIDLQGFGVPNCIIFQPKGLDTRSGGAYAVQITGLESIQGKPATVVYVVKFFNEERQAAGDGTAME